MGGIEKEIKKYLKQFRYSNVRQIMNTERLVIKPEGFFFQLKNYKDIYSDKEGGCGDLSSVAYHELSERYPEHEFWKAWGTDPVYFSTEKDSHFFLIKKSLNGEGELLIDPSFKIVRPLKGSGYKIRKLSTPDKIPLVAAYVLPFGHSMFIKKQGNGILNLACGKIPGKHYLMLFHRSKKKAQQDELIMNFDRYGRYSEDEKTSGNRKIKEKLISLVKNIQFSEEIFQEQDKPLPNVKTY